MRDEVYCWPPDFIVLKNSLGIHDASELDYVEREFTTVRMNQPAPTGQFDLAHLKAIHHHLFQDVYDWAGQLRTVEISKGGSKFQFRRFIETGMADIHRRLVERRFLQGLTAWDFADGAGEIIGDINHVHPFREGNGRTQMIYLRQLGAQAGHRIDLTRIGKDAWMDASRHAHLGRYAPMADCIRVAID